MNWGDVLNMTGWFSVARLATPYVDVGSEVIRLADGMYTHPVPYNEALDPADPGCPYAGLVLWAESDGAARRALSRDIEADDATEKRTVLPPPDVRGVLHGEDFGQILENAKRMRLEVMETASYRIAQDGQFVAKCLSVGTLRYFFRKRSGAKREKPFAIEIALPRQAEGTAAGTAQ